MITRGEFVVNKHAYGVILNHTKQGSEAVLVENNTVVSAYKIDITGRYSYINNKAKEFVELVLDGVKGCKSTNGQALPWEKGTLMEHMFTRKKVEYTVQLYRNEVIGMYATRGEDTLRVERALNAVIPSNIPYIRLTEVNKDLELSENELDAIPTRSVEEIALEKEDVSWLKKKKYYIVNNDEDAERLFSFLDNYNGIISYDTETTGLKINCFGKIGSKYMADLEKHNAEHPDDRVRADRLVGIIFCVEPDVSYYFPCFNRKFKNLYEDKNSPIRKKIIQNIRARYTIGEGVSQNHIGDMMRYIHNTPDDEIRLDVILMERVRHILETKHIVAHHGSFEWKVGWQYEIDTNLKDDSMLMHQLMYKFRSTTANSGEPSNLKYLTKVELGIDQWELKDFFPNWKEDKKGTVRERKDGKSKGTQIDFSYMDYEGSRVYAPADGDFTLQLVIKYKDDMIKNHSEMLYIYEVEMLVSCAIGYMEFYGHRIDESKILGAREDTRANILMIEHEIRSSIGYNQQEENELFNKLVEIKDEIKNEKDHSKIDNELIPKMTSICEQMRKAIDSDEEHQINLSAPGQVADLLYNKLGYPMQSDKMSVAKKEIKALIKERDSDGNLKYPVASLYSKYKNETTLMTKFFDNLPYFMYPGGFIFSSYGQIATATGRMSCNRPNAQQYPKVITKIIIPREDFVMVDADYSQIEYRVLTALAKNEGLAKLFADPDSDYHTLMASLMYDVPYASVTPQMRSAAKSFNFGIPYGMGFGSLAILLTGKNTEQTREEAKEKYEMYFKNQPKTRVFFSDIKEMAQIYKYTKTLFNRYRYYTFTDKDGNINEAKKAASLRQAGNAVIQGCIHGDTLIQTKELGIVRIKDAVDTHLQVWNGEKWADGDILYSGKKQKCIVTFSNGQKFICSPTHKFLVRSHKGNDRFVECKDLLTKEKSKNPHRVVVNTKYEPSDQKYSSEWAYGFKSYLHNANNVFIEDIGDSFKAGMVLGRLASDGSVLNREANALGIKHNIHNNIFMDTELLRGFIKGMFDGDGGISGKVITLTFGSQYDFEPMCRDLQKALAFFGIRSRYYKYEHCSKLTIKTNDNEKFMSTIGFINEHKQKAGENLECVRDEYIFGQVIIPESVEITDEYIDMYDVCNTDEGYYVADGIITHNTAADIFKISVARNFSWIRRNKLLGLLLIINMIHDEQLMEISSKYLNVTKALSDIGENMQFEIEGFPPLYIGAGCGTAWGYAKGKMAEIHPTLLQHITEQNKFVPLFKAEPKATVEDDQKNIANMVYEFRRSKVANYLSNPDNWHKAIHPAIGGLINLQFNYGRGDDAKAYVGPNGETYSDSEFLELNIADFLKENNISAEPKWFSADEMVDEREEEDDAEYDDSDDDEISFDDTENELSEELATVYKKIEEDSSLYGSDISDLVKTFGCVVLPKKKLIGFDVRGMQWRNLDALVTWIEQYTYDDSTEGTDGGMEIAFFKDGNILNKTGIYVRGLDREEAEKQYNIIKNTKKFASVIDYKAGDIHNRSQAK